MTKRNNKQLLPWWKVALDYLATRGPDLLERCLASRPTPKIARLLRLVHSGDSLAVLRLGTELSETLRTEGRNEEALTTQLISADAVVRQLEVLEHYDVRDRRDVLQASLTHCQLAISISHALDHLPCLAMYYFQMALALEHSGSLPDARRSYDQALTRYRSLIANNNEYLPQFVVTLDRLGYVLRASGEMATAQHVYEEAYCKRHQMPSRPVQGVPNAPDILCALAAIHRALFRFPEATVAYRKAIIGYRHLVRQDAAFHSRLAIALSNLGSLMGEQCELRVARRYLQAAITIQRQLVASTPDHTPELASSLNNLGSVFYRSGRLKHATSLCEEALCLYEALAPAEALAYLPTKARILINLTTILRGSGLPQRAASTCEAALAIYRQLLGLNPLVHLGDEARALVSLGVLRREAGQLAGAKEAYSSALRMYNLLPRASRKAHFDGIATAFNNLGTTLQAVHELEGARQCFRKALRIWQTLSLKHSRWMADLAMTLNNLGNVLRQLRELDGAIACCDKALEIRRQLAVKEPTVHLPEVAMTQTNLGNIFVDLRQYEKARAAYTEAINVYRDLNARDAKRYTALLGTALNNFGYLLLELHDCDGAATILREALDIRRALAARQPSVWASVASTMNNLGIALVESGDYGQAESFFVRALDLEQKSALWLDSAETHTNIGLLRVRQDRTSESRTNFELAVEYCERGMYQLPERDHRDRFKARIEAAYDQLIGVYAGRLQVDGDGQGLADYERLLGLLESLRQVQTLASLGVMDQERGTSWRGLAAGVTEGEGRVAKMLLRNRCALLWVHSVFNFVVFVMLVPGRCVVEIAEARLLRAAWSLFDEVENAFARFPAEAQKSLATVSDNITDHEDRVRNAARLAREKVAHRIPELGKQAFSELPSGIRSLLAGREYDTIVLFPCSATMNLPFEMLHDGQGYIGLRQVLPRVNGLGAFCSISRRQPKGQSAVVVGNPTHRGLPELMEARRTAAIIAELLNANPILDEDATRRRVLEALGRDGPRIWLQMGHGGRSGEASGGEGEYLAMAGRERILSEDIAQLRWPNHPVVHQDCCFVGWTRGVGGGRFEGHASAALRAGASCVLSSVHPLWDDEAAKFSMRFYEKVLNVSNPVKIGQALLETRREVAREHLENPLIWGTTVLWGNPWACLVDGAVQHDWDSDVESDSDC